MEKSPVNFKQVRDFGEIFNDTFTFIGQEFKPLIKSIIYYALPFLIVAAILSVFVSIEQQKFTNSIRSADPTMLTDPWSTMGGTYKYAFFTMLVYIIGISALQCTILGYIKLYVFKGKDQFTHEDVYAQVKKYLFPVMGISVLLMMLIFIGLILCVIPGIILAVSLSLIFVAYIYEENSFGGSFNRSFQLTGQKWWMSFGLILVFYIMVYLLMLLLSLPAILMGLKTFLGAFTAEPEELQFSTAFYVVNSITSVFTYLLISIPFIGMAFQYFNLVEMRERSSLHDKIEQIG